MKPQGLHGGGGVQLSVTSENVRVVAGGGRQRRAPSSRDASMLTAPAAQVKMSFFHLLSTLLLLRPQGFHRLELRCLRRRDSCRTARPAATDRPKAASVTQSGRENGHLEQDALAQDQAADGAEDDAHDAAEAAEHGRPR